MLNNTVINCVYDNAFLSVKVEQLMSLRIKLLAVALLVTVSLFAQKNNTVLLTVDGQPITAGEFIRVYNKNLDLVKDDTQKDVDTYLELFTNYQLKLSEAKRLKLDEDPKYKREFLNYKKQLIKNYLSESKVTETLVREAYDRMAYDVKAVHVLVKLNSAAKDTTKAYNELLGYRKRMLKEGFEALRKDIHNGSTIFAEDLGYFSAFKMVYDFENMAYKTKVGEVSMPFRTDFGYHIVKVIDKRPSRGTISAAHIMIALKQKDSLLDPQERINEIYKKLQQGESFESLARQFSEDKSSARKGGELAPFKSGQLSSVTFEDMAFGLQKDGDVSEPFKTEYGWHIVKRLNKKDIQPYNEAKAMLRSRVKRDSRSKLINSAMANELKRKYVVEENKEALNYFESILSDSYFMRSWRLPEDFSGSQILFTINDKPFSYGEFGQYLIKTQGAYLNKRIPLSLLVEKEYKTFFENSILKFRETNLEEENEEFANILKEYRDGLLLFDLMEKEVWNKASKDTLGLKAFYNRNVDNYKWNDRIDIVMASSADESVASKVTKRIGKTEAEDIKKEFNTDGKQNVIFTSGIFDVNDPILPQDLKVKKGVSKVYAHNNAFHVVNVKEVLPSRVKTLDEARGNVINDYQKEIEDKWLLELKSRFKVVLNDKVLRLVKSQLNK